MDNHLGEIDQNATGALVQMISAAQNFVYLILTPNELGNMYVIWRDKKKIAEYLKDKNIPSHNKLEKIRKINQSKTAVLKNLFTDTTLFGMRPDDNRPIVISDGIHRAIGVYRALKIDPSIERKLCIRLLLFEGSEIANLEDYRLSTP